VVLGVVVRMGVVRVVGARKRSGGGGSGGGGGGGVEFLG
jgi:hypothetical protein